MQVLLSNLKTTLTGVAVLAVTITYLLNRIDTTAYLAAVGALTATGFLLSGDAKK